MENPDSGKRFGEADRPWPELRILCANVTALGSKWDLIAKREWDIALL